MTIAYVNTSPQSALVEYPRAVYRVTLQRQGIASLVMAAGVVSWPDVVEEVVSAAGHSPFGVPLGYARPGSQDATAVVDIRAGSMPVLSVSDSVGDLARVMDTASPFARLTRIERLAPVPVAGSADEAARDAARKREEAAAAAAAAESSITATVGRALSRVGTVSAIAIGVGALVAFLWLAGLARKGAGGGGPASWE